MTLAHDNNDNTFTRSLYWRDGETRTIIGVVSTSTRARYAPSPGGAAAVPPLTAADTRHPHNISLDRSTPLHAIVDLTAR